MRMANQISISLALNESTIKRGNRTMVADISIEEDLFEKFRGDGLSISTPTGSTAYNKSVGGAVLHPSINAFQLAEIASLNNRVFRTLGSPIVVGHHEWVKVQLQQSTDYLVTIDQFTIEQEEIDAIYYRIADERIHFASYRHMHFLESGQRFLYWRRINPWNLRITILDKDSKSNTFEGTRVSKGLLAKIKFQGGKIFVNDHEQNVLFSFGAK